MLWSSFLCQALLWMASLWLTVAGSSFSSSQGKEIWEEEQGREFWELRGGSPPAAETDKDWKPESAHRGVSGQGGEELCSVHICHRAQQRHGDDAQEDRENPGRGTSPFPPRGPPAPTVAFPKAGSSEHSLSCSAEKRTWSQKKFRKYYIPPVFSPLHFNLLETGSCLSVDTYT